MEGVPRLPMLRTTLKTSPEKTDYSRKIRWQIRELFNEDPNSYQNEIRDLESLRATACHPPQDFTGCALLKKYYCQLHFLQNRFSFEESGRDECFFTWTDMYTGIAYSTTDVKHEMACVLYNMGALHMNLGAIDNRQTPEGMKMSCSHFQCAAWAFQQLNEKYPQPRETDLCHEIIRFLGTTSLAQAQECILEKSMVDGRKPGIVAKVAAQIVDYYKTALKVLEQSNAHPDGNAVIEVAGSKAYKAWKKYAEFKMTFYQCVALLYMGIQSEESQKMGERVAFYQAACDKLNEAAKLAKKLDGYAEAINDAVSFSHDVVGGKLKAAEKENEFVYHEKVPDRSSLPDIKGASLVKGTPFDVQDPEVAGQDIFHRLVPMEAHEASSLYSEEKAKLLRRIGGLIEEKDQELALFLTTLQLDQFRLHQDPAAPPQELVDRCAAFNAETDAIQKLIDAMSELSSVYTDVESSLAEVKQLLEDEQAKERQYHGKRPPGMILNELSLEANRLSEVHAKGAESNTQLHSRIEAHLPNLRTLCLPLAELLARLPSVQGPDSSRDQAATRELQRLLDKVDEMRKQRVTLYTQFRDGIQSDDITKLATHQTDLEALFAHELDKHQRVTSLIEQNVSAQEKILIALTEANSRYADTRRTTGELQQKRSAVVAALLESADIYPEMLAKCNQGLEYYNKMEANVSKLLTRVRSVCRVQQEERDQQQAARSRTANEASVCESEGPKLKDFLHLMKKKDNAATAPPAAAAETAANQFAYPRPTPLGAEQDSQGAPYAAMDPNAFYYHQSYPGYAGYAASSSAAPSTASSAPAYTYPYYQGYPSGYPSYMGQQMSTAPASSGNPPVPAVTSAAAYQSYAPPTTMSQGTNYLSHTAPVSSSSASVPPTGYTTPSSYTNPYHQNVYHQTSYGGNASSVASNVPPTPTTCSPSSAVTSTAPAPSYVNPYQSPYYQELGNAGTPAYGAVPPTSYHGATPSVPSSTCGSNVTTAIESPAPPSSYAVANPPASSAYPEGASSTYSQYPYQAYQSATASTSTLSAATYPNAYHYLGQHNNPVDSYGGFNHGMTGSTITGPSMQFASSPASMGSSASGTGQYQQYPYHATPTDAANPYYAANAFNQQPYQQQQQPVLQPTPATSAPSVAPTATPAKAASNLELLSLLDQSVPANASGGALPAALEPQSGHIPLGGSVAHQGTTTLTGSNRNASTGTVSTGTESGKSISSSMESSMNVTLALSTEMKSSSEIARKDPLSDPETALRLASEVEKLGKLVDGLTRKSLNGPTSLDARWKDVQDIQEKESSRRSISVARCYPMKNRLPDVLPYDHNRIELPTTKDDYINASLIPSLSSGAPSFIATQAPLACSQQDFWTMIWQQSVEIVVCLLSDPEMTKPGSSASGVYWPVEKGRDVTSGPWTVSLQSSNVRPYCHERILALTKQGEAKQRVLAHLQFSLWPGSSFPASPAQFLQLISQTLHFWEQQRSRSHPIVVHCLAGAGRTGLFCLLATALSDLSDGNGLIDVVRVAGALCQHRRNMFRDREHLLFAYQALLYHAQDLLLKRGILSGTGSLQGSPVKKSPHPSQDFTLTSPSELETAVAEPESVAKPEGVAEKQDKEGSEQIVEANKCPSSPVVPAMAILDPANFTLDGARQRVTKNHFLNRTSSQLGSAPDPTDPLSQLDPLWSLAKP